jgi:hypothetical protein
MNGLLFLTAAEGAVERVVNALPEGLLIVLFVWGLLRLLRRQNAGTRFAVWFLALLAVAALPLLAGVGEGGRLLAPGMSWGHLHPAITIPGSWARFAVIGWAIGASVGLARLGMGLWRLRQMRRSCTTMVASDLDPMLQKTLDALGAAGSGVGKPIAIATSEEMRVPGAIGFGKRTIVLPAWALRELAAEDLNVILLHEVAHLRRGDDWTNLIQKVVRAIFFFHPAVWWIENRLSVEREMACDDAVLAQTSNPQGYASCLVSLLEKSLAHRLSQRQLSMAQAAVRRAREASLRLARILDANRPRATGVWKPALGAVGVFSMVCLMALPHAPQFIGFDSGVGANGERANAAARAESSLPSPVSLSGAVIPASFHVDAGMAAERTTPGNAMKVRASRTGSTPARSTDRRLTDQRLMVTATVGGANVIAGRRVDQGQARADRWNADPMRAQLVEFGMGADQELMPQFQTLVFIEATPYRTGDSMVWSVQVWHLTLVNAPHERFVRVPVASSI